MAMTHPDPLADSSGPRGYSIDEAARRTGVGRTLFYDLVRRNQIKTVTIGRRRIVPSTEIARLLSVVED